MTTARADLRPHSHSLALEQRLLFDGAGAVGFVDAFDDPSSDRATQEDTSFKPFDEAAGSDKQFVLEGDPKTKVMNGDVETWVDAQVTLEITVTGGTATMTGATSVGDTLTMTGTQAALNAALKTLEFTPEDDQNSSVSGYESSLKFVASYNDGTTDRSAEKTVELSVSAVNDAPDLSGGVALKLKEGEQNIKVTLDQFAPTLGDLDVDIITGQQVGEQLVVEILSLPEHGELLLDGGVVRPGMVIALTDIIAGKLTYSHNGTDIEDAEGLDLSFGVRVYDGGGGETDGTIDLLILPANKAPTVSGPSSMYEGSTQNVAPSINLNDALDKPEDATIEISDLNSAGQGKFFLDRESGREYLVDGSTHNLTALELALLSFEHDGTESDAPGVVPPSYRVTVTDSGGGEGEEKALTTTEIITIDVLPNNDDPTLKVNTGATVDVNGKVLIGSSNLQLTDQDRNPSNPAETTPLNQLVYTIETLPKYGNLQLLVNGAWVTLDKGSRFTQADIKAGHVQYQQTVFTENGENLAEDGFVFTARDSAYGLDLTDPANPVPGYEGAVRTKGGEELYPGGPTKEIFVLTLVPNPDKENTDPEGNNNPIPPVITPPDGVNNPPSNVGSIWYENNVDLAEGTGYPLSGGMLKYEITYPVEGGTETVAAAETVYTLMSQPGNGVLQRQVDGQWKTIGNNSQFTQDDIDQGRIRFRHDGTENHKSSFDFRVSDGTAASLEGTFEIHVVPTNDRPIASGGKGEVLEGVGSSVALTKDHLGMSDLDDGKHPNVDDTGHGAADSLWFRVDGLVPSDAGTLERWNGSAWVAVTAGEWLPEALLSMPVTEGEKTWDSGLRFTHSGAEPTGESGVPEIKLNYSVRDDLSAPDSALDVKTDADHPIPPPGTNGGEEHLSSAATSTIQVIPVNDAPVVPDRPGLGGDPATKGVNKVLTGVPEGGTVTITNDNLQAVDRDNSEVQRQYRITETPSLGSLTLSGKILGVGSTFTQADIDAGRLKYVNNGNELDQRTTGFGSVYNDKFHFVVSDGALTDAGDAADANVFLIQIEPTNDLPELTKPAGNGYAMEESGTPTSLPGWKVADRDLGDAFNRPTVNGEENFLRVEISSPHSDVKISFTGGDPALTTRAYSSGIGTNSVILQGTAKEIQDALDALQVTFVGGGNANIETTLTVTVDDQLYTSGGNLDGSAANGGLANQNGLPVGEINRVSETITLYASNTNEAPTLTNSNTGYTVNEDGTVTLDGFTLDDSDSFDLPVNVVVKLYADAARTTLVTPAEHGGLVSGSSQVSSLTLTGTMAEVQAQLNALQYKGAQDFNNGPVYLEVVFTDYGHADVPGGQTATVTREIEVVPVNDLPELSLVEDVFVMADPSSPLALGTVGGSVNIVMDDSVDLGQLIPGQEGFDQFTVTIQAKVGSKHDYVLSADGVSSVDGVLTLTGTQAQINDALETLTYTTTNNNADATYEFVIEVNDRSNGNEVADGADTSVSKAFQIFVSGVNDPAKVTPEADGYDATSNSITFGEDRVIELGEFEFTITDPDHNGAESMTLTVTVPEGLSLFGNSGVEGEEHIFRLTGTEEELQAALNALTVILPDHWNGDFDVTIEVNDGGNTGTRPGALTDDTDEPRQGGGDFSYADVDGTSNELTTTRIVTVKVTPENDAPVVIDPSDAVDFGAVVEDSGETNPGKTVSDLFGGRFSDAKDAQSGNQGGSVADTLAGVFITSNTAHPAQGVWEYSKDGGSTWFLIPTNVSEGNAFFLSESAEVRFSPTDNFHGLPGGLSARLVETSSGTPATGDRASVSGVNSGGTTAISADAVNLTTTVTPINDAPTLSGDASLPSLDEDSAVSPGMAAADLLDQMIYSDATDDRTSAADGLGGSTATDPTAIAIVGNDANANEGAWEYTLDGGANWLAVPTGVNNDASAIVLDVSNGDHQVRFVPKNGADFNGTPGKLTVRVADGTWNSPAGVQDLTGNIDGIHAWSEGTGTVGITVIPSNDAPTIEGVTDTDISVSEAPGVVGGTAPSIGPVDLLTGTIIVDDLDLGTTDGLVGTIFGTGRVEVTFTDGFDGDTFSIPTGMDGVESITGGTVVGGESTDLVITFEADATLEQVAAVLKALQYSHQGDNPTNYGDRTAIEYTVTLFDGNNSQAGGNAGGPNELSADPIHGTITITADNDPPQAHPDSNTIEKGTLDVGGSVRGNDTDPDNPTTDLEVTEIVPNGGTAVPVDPDPDTSTVIPGEYGELTIHPDGSYTYTPNADDPRVYGLQDGDEPLKETFGYTIKDPDGSASSSTLTITITGKDGDPPTIIPEDKNGAVGGDPNANGHNTVKEADLRNNGTASTAGSITLTVPDGIKTVTIDGETLTVAQLQGLGTEPITIETADGILVLNGFSSKDNNSAPRDGTISYTYTLKGSVGQPGKAESTDTFGLTVLDQGNKSSNGTLVIQILDDVPTARADSNAVTEDVNSDTSTINGNVLTGGSTGDVADEQGADGATVTEVAAGPTVTTPGTGVMGTYGILTLNADGTYTYELDNTNPSIKALSQGSTLTEVFRYTITDADGDVSSTTLTITINGANNPPEANTDTSTIEKGTPSVGGDIRDNDTDPESPTTDLVVTEIVPNGGTAVPVKPNPSTPTVIPGEYGELTIHPDGSYTYAPNQDDPRVYGLQDGDTPLEETFGYTIKDPGGKTDKSTLTITITGKDGAPPTIIPEDGNGAVGGDPDANGHNTVDEADLRDGGTASTTGSITLTVPDGIKTVTIGGQTLTVDQLQGLSITTPITIETADGILVLTGFSSTDNNSAPRDGTISYTYTLKGSVDQPGQVESTDTFGLTVVDQGNKPSTDTLVIQILDDAPTAVADSNSVTENVSSNTSSINGNVLTGGSIGDVADEQGADGATVTEVAAGSTVAGTPGGVGNGVTGTYGTLTLNVDGTYTYVLDNTDPSVKALNVGETLTEVFSYTITDADGDTSTTTLAITINGANNPPEANTDTVTIEKGTPSVPGNVRDNDTDPDNPVTELVVTEIVPGKGPDKDTPFGFDSADPSAPIVIPGEYGELTIHPNGSYTYTPNPDDPRVYGLQAGDTPLEETFGYTINDPDGSPSSSTLTITITGKDGAPPTITPEDRNGEVGGDPNANGHNTVNEADLRNNGTASTPGSITLLVPDGIKTVTIGGESLTVAQLQGLGTTPITIETTDGILVLTGFSSKDNNSAPRDGTISYTYTLKGPVDQNGQAESTDTFDLKVVDQGDKEQDSELIIQILDDAPTAVADSNVVTENVSSNTSSTNGNVLTGGSASDVADEQGADGATVTEVAAGTTVTGTPGGVGAGVAGAYGALTLHADGSYTYTLDNTNTTVMALNVGDTLTETFSYTITDSDGDASTTTLTITINGANNPPEANTDTGTIEKGTPSVPGNVRDNDIDPDNPTTDLVVTEIVPNGGTAVPVNPDPSTPTVIPGEYGELTIHPDGSYIYTPNQDDPRVYGLQDGDPPLEETFGYTINDPDGSPSSSTLTITITGKNGEPPLLTPVDGNGNVEGEATVYEKGLLDPNDPSESASGTITVKVPDGMTSLTVEGTTFTIGELLNLTSGNPSAPIDTGEGTIVITGVTIPNTEDPSAPRDAIIHYTYTLKDPVGQPNADSSTDKIRLTVTDQGGKPGTGTLTIQIVDDLPAAADDVNNIGSRGTSINGNVVSGNDSLGADGPVVGGPVTGVFAGTNVGTVGSGLPGTYGTLTLHPDGSYTYELDRTNTSVLDLPLNGTLMETFTYTITDADGDTSTATLTITIMGDNAPPVATDDGVFKTIPGLPINNIPVLGNDSDPDNDPLTVTEASVPPGMGTVTINPDGTLTYVPPMNQLGEVRITYTITDGFGGTSTAEVVIEIEADPTPPAPTTPPRLDTPRPGTGNPLDPLSHLITGEQVRDPSVWFYGDTWLRVQRMPIPFHPIVYVGGAVRDAQGQRGQTDYQGRADTSYFPSANAFISPVGASLGMDPSLFVQHAIRGSQHQGDWLNALVAGRLGRVSLSSDNLLAAPELGLPPAPEALSEQEAAGADRTPEQQQRQRLEQLLQQQVKQQQEQQALELQRQRAVEQQRQEGLEQQRQRLLELEQQKRQQQQSAPQSFDRYRAPTLGWSAPSFSDQLQQAQADDAQDALHLPEEVTG